MFLRRLPYTHQEIRFSFCKLSSLSFSSNAPQKNKERKKDVMDTNTFRSLRMKYVESKMNAKEDPYPSVSISEVSFEDFSDKVSMLKNGEIAGEMVNIAVSGRLIGRRTVGNKLSFNDIQVDNGIIQVEWNAGRHKEGLDDYKIRNSEVKRGDVVAFRGFPKKTASGGLSLVAEEILLHSPSLRLWPPRYFGLKDKETRYRQRYLDTTLDENSWRTFTKRSEMLSYIRRFLLDRNFVEMTTPTLVQTASGANAKPFITHHNALDLDLCLRVAPELFLKKALIGGYRRVFELGSVFRNEGIDNTHNPEFSICELYAAYKDVDWLFTFTEKLISGLVKELTGSYQLVVRNSDSSETVAFIDFTPPFRRLNVYETLVNAVGPLPEPHMLHTEEGRAALDAVCSLRDIDCAPPRTSARLLDKLIGELVEPSLVQPTFIVGHPQVMSPLAKAHPDLAGISAGFEFFPEIWRESLLDSNFSRDLAGISARFELFVAGLELVNAYSEENDPIKQKVKFEQQMKPVKVFVWDPAMGEMGSPRVWELVRQLYFGNTGFGKMARREGDAEAAMPDVDFVHALEWGMPPAAGWGLGVDRLLMLLLGHNSIKEVLMFPAMKPKEV